MKIPCCSYYQKQLYPNHHTRYASNSDSAILFHWDNPVKTTLDVLSKKYGFNDKLIRKAIVETEIVNKGKEYVEFEVRTIR